MKFEGIGIAATATWIPKTTESVEDALASGSLSEDDLEGLGVKELPVSEDLSAVEMAVLAAESALTDLDAVAHAWTFHQGYDMWSPPHYIADKLGAGRRTLPYGIQQSCNGGATALLLAAQAHASDPTSKASLVTTADRFGAPVWDRWASNPAVPLGDGATAAVIHRAAPSSARERARIMGNTGTGRRFHTISYLA
jgi:3-oxoacyl-[acyl-carrier-protein] synthase-3